MLVPNRMTKNLSLTILRWTAIFHYNRKNTFLNNFPVPEYLFQIQSLANICNLPLLNIFMILLQITGVLWVDVCPRDAHCLA